MNWRILSALVLALAMVPLAPGALASHFQTYGNYPTEHDDIGSSSEPDFRSVTGVLGVPVNERAVDTNLDGFGEASSNFPSGKALAPGCTDDSGRRPNGLCGLYTIGAFNVEGTDTGQGVPPRTLGVQGTSGAGAPGLTGAKGTEVRFLDQVVVGDYAVPLLGTHFIDYNKKFQDSGLGASLRALDPNFGGQALAYSVAHMAWYGKWADKNGNGVIDHLQAGGDPTTGFPIQNPDNEFQWYGNCIGFDQRYRVGWFCADESLVLGHRVAIDAWIFPGNHHAFCGAIPVGPPTGYALTQTCPYVGTDFPGASMLCLVDASTASVLPVITIGLSRCFTFDTNDIDENDALFEGDPIFGVQDSVAPDQGFDDRTGDDGWDTRMWAYGLGWATYYYDASLVTGTTMITGANCKEDPGSPRELDLASCRFVDVDQYRSWSPALEQFVGGLKPSARSTYTFARDGLGPVNRGLDGQINNKRTDLSPTTGPLNDQLQNPGWSREPNAAGDSYPGASRGACGDGDAQHNGWCNSYAGYQAGFKAWVDNQAIRAITYDRAIGVEGLPGCLVCIAGPGLTTTDSPEPLPGAFPRADGDHRRSMGPGQYFFAGVMGRWNDRAQTWKEEYLDLNVGSATFGQILSKPYTNAPDGWVGNIVNNTGFFYYRGYSDEACATDQGSGTHTYAECHPYADGAFQDPQAAGILGHGEWQAKCEDTVGTGNARFTMRPVSGTWSVPIFVLRNHESLELPKDVAKLEDYSGKSGAAAVISLAFGCRVPEIGLYLGGDLVILPEGNLGVDVITELVANVPLASGTGFEQVRDVDVYHAWGA